MYLLQTIQNELSDPKTMYTLAGSTTAVFFITNGLQSALNFNPKWLGLVLSLLISLTGVYLSKGEMPNYLAGIVNGFIIYSSAAGGTHILNGNKTKGGGTGGGTPANTTPVVQPSAQKRAFLSQWW
jgi:hypothetical protein